MATLDELLRQAMNAGSKSLVLHAGRPPAACIEGGNRALAEGPLTADEVRALCVSVLSDDEERLVFSTKTVWKGQVRTSLGLAYMVAVQQRGRIGAVIAVGSPGVGPTQVMPHLEPKPASSEWPDDRPGVGPTVGLPDLERKPASHEWPDDLPGDAAIPAILAGVVPPRAGRDAKPLPCDAGDIEPPRDL